MTTRSTSFHPAGLRPRRMRAFSSLLGILALIMAFALFTGCEKQKEQTPSTESADEEKPAKEKEGKRYATAKYKASRSKANIECQSLYIALVVYYADNSSWPVAVDPSDGVVNSADYIKLCKALTGENPAGKAYFEPGAGYDESKGILDPWNRQYQIALDGNYDGVISENSVPAVKAVNKAAGRSGQNLRARAAVYSFGVSEDDEIANDLAKLAERKRLVTSW